MKIYIIKILYIFCCFLISSCTSQKSLQFNFGKEASHEIVQKLDISISPDGHNLPNGNGHYQKGKQLYFNLCASCHGQNLEGNSFIDAPALIGGRNSLTSDKPLKTVESFWPYSTTLFDYIRRAMPFGNPILTNNEVYSLTAFILAKANIINKTDILNKKTLPKINMPNKMGFNIIEEF